MAASAEFVGNLICSDAWQKLSQAIIDRMVTMSRMRMKKLTRMWADAQRDGRPAKYRRRLLLNAAKFD